MLADRERQLEAVDRVAGEATALDLEEETAVTLLTELVAKSASTIGDYRVHRLAREFLLERMARLRPDGLCAEIVAERGEAGS